jgi:hypothetical protein
VAIVSHDELFWKLAEPKLEKNWSREQYTSELGKRVCFHIEGAST